MSVSKRQNSIKVPYDDSNFDKIMDFVEFLTRVTGDVNNKEALNEMGCAIAIHSYKKNDKKSNLEINLEYYVADKPSRATKVDYGVAGLLYNPETGFLYLADTPIEKFIPLVDLRLLIKNQLEHIIFGSGKADAALQDSFDINNLDLLDEFLQSAKFYDAAIDSAAPDKNLLELSLSSIGKPSVSAMSTFMGGLLAFKQVSDDAGGADLEASIGSVLNANQLICSVTSTILNSVGLYTEFLSLLAPYIGSRTGLVPLAMQSSVVREDVFADKLNVTSYLPAPGKFDDDFMFLSNSAPAIMGGFFGLESAPMMGTNPFFNEEAREYLKDVKKTSKKVQSVIMKYYDPDVDTELDITDQDDKDKYEQALNGLKELNNENRGRAKLLGLTDFTSFKMDVNLTGSAPIPEPSKSDYDYLINFLEDKKDMPEIEKLGLDALKKSAENLIKSKVVPIDVYEKFVDTVDSLDVMPAITLMTKHVAEVLRLIYQRLTKAFS